MAQPTATVHRPLTLGVVHVRAGWRHGESAVRPQNSRISPSPAGEIRCRPACQPQWVGKPVEGICQRLA